jgi:hypothetical protein
LVQCLYHTPTDFNVSAVRRHCKFAHSLGVALGLHFRLPLIGTATVAKPRSISRHTASAHGLVAVLHCRQERQ